MPSTNQKSEQNAGWTDTTAAKTEMDKKMEATEAPPVRYSAAKKSAMIAVAAIAATSMWGCGNDDDGDDGDGGGSGGSSGGGWSR